MKALTLHAPWAWATCYLGKRVENRTWAPPLGIIGQRIAIHAGALSLWKEATFLEIHRAIGSKLTVVPIERRHVFADTIAFRDEGTRFCSAIVATARLVAVESPMRGLPRMLGWRASNQYGWVLQDVHVLERPVKCRGLQKLWNLPEDVEREVGGIQMCPVCGKPTVAIPCEACQAYVDEMHALASAEGLLMVEHSEG